MEILIIHVALVLCCLSEGHSSGEFKYPEIFVSISGSDSARCGQQSNPCKSIAKAVHRVNGNNGRIYLNGTGTEREPFNCSSGTQHGIKVQKNVSILGIISTPTVHISCFGGFMFHRTTERELSISLSDIVFQQTPLTFEGCTFVQLSRCSFRNASTAVYMRNISNTKLNIQSSSFLDNGVSCVRIFLTSKARRTSLTVNISGTTFQRNGCIGNHSMKVGAVTIESAVKAISSDALVEIICSEANYIRNCGHFVRVKLPNVIVNGTFVDVTLARNEVGRHQKRSRIVESLFYSKATKCYAKLANVGCNSNRLLRCIEIECDESHIEIQNSSFCDQNISHGKGAALSLQATSYAVLHVLDSLFKNNTAEAGGALYLHSENGTIKLLLSRVNFTECAAEKYGCTMLIGSPQGSRITNGTATFKLIANFNGIHVDNCSAIKVPKKRRTCNVFHFLVFSANFKISDSSWTNNRNGTDATFVVGNTGGKTDITITKCFFGNNSARIYSSVIFEALNTHAGSVLIENTTFLNQHKNIGDQENHALRITPEFRIKLSNVVISSRNATGLVISSFEGTKPKDNKVNIDISRSTFLNCAQDILVNLINSMDIKFTITNSIFSTKNAGPKDLGISLTEKNVNMRNTTNTSIRLENVTFLSRPCNAFDQLSPGLKTIQIRNSTFKDAVCSHRRLSKYHHYFARAGSVAIQSLPDILKKSGCVPNNTNENVHRLWNYKSTVIFEDSTFEGNVGLKAGAVILINGNVTFNRCKFKNNFANLSSGHVYAEYGTGQIHFKDCSFLRTTERPAANGDLFKRTAFLKSESAGPLVIENTTMVSNLIGRNRSPMVLILNGGYVHIDDKSSMKCSAGSKLLFENTTHFQYGYAIDGSFCKFNVTVLDYSCMPCSPGFYSLQRGVMRGLNSRQFVHCHTCPFGATCIEKNVVARPNFWGYPNSNNSRLTFYPCPEGYCQTPPSRSDARQYNHCVGNRSGFLCGKCAPEYSETLFSTECRKKNECNNHMFWIITILYTTAMAVYLFIKPPILSFLWKQIFWFRKREGYTAIVELDGTMEENSESGGYLKIVFYFYQAAELLMVGSAEHLFLHKIPFVLSIIEVFNFQVRTLQRPIGCPFAGLTAVTKEVLLSGTIFLILAELVTIYCLHFAFNKIRRKEGPSVIHFIAVIVELLLLGYERLAESSLNLMHCFPVGKEKRLFVDAEIVCWQWWQYLLLAYIIVFVVPFILVLYFGSSKLYAASISAKEFLGACIFPLPFLMYWSLRKVFLTRSNTSRVTQNNKDLLEVMHGPFRQPKDNDNGTLYWESVLICRRLVLLCCHAFITNSMFRLICMSVACIVIMLHHVIKSPFKDCIANRSETASLLILTLMAVINLSKATLMSFGITIDGPATSYLEVLDWFQVCVLAFVPSMLAVFLILAVLSQLGRLIVFLSKAIFRFVIQKESFTPLAFAPEFKNNLSYEINS
ncbi:LOW QUALITY PROTEIN: uncharacterized protein LOC122959940 [Acropora millepora]|uniref:LOW QUALITY PROTEIN: uncharacterized protein LOC122959940 n=1 Tax=Acropora millepora TaxID=45264 RepID=UPI001CF311C4|nr:LOW QUALITY PROTEIN: uncharacterized protein LOC122959940 [Acropora millepora]